MSDPDATPDTATHAGPGSRPLTPEGRRLAEQAWDDQTVRLRRSRLFVRECDLYDPATQPDASLEDLADNRYSGPPERAVAHERDERERSKPRRKRAIFNPARPYLMGVERV